MENLQKEKLIRLVDQFGKEVVLCHRKKNDPFGVQLPAAYPGLTFQNIVSVLNDLTSYYERTIATLESVLNDANDSIVTFEETETEEIGSLQDEIRDCEVEMERYKNFLTDSQVELITSIEKSIDLAASHWDAAAASHKRNVDNRGEISDRVFLDTVAIQIFAGVNKMAYGYSEPSAVWAYDSAEILLAEKKKRLNKE